MDSCSYSWAVGAQGLPSLSPASDWAPERNLGGDGGGGGYTMGSVSACLDLVTIHLLFFLERCFCKMVKRPGHAVINSYKELQDTVV